MKLRFIAKFWKKLGPGLVTGSSDNDPSGIATYSQAGASFGLLTLWTALVTYPLMYGIQEMCARIGITTGKGLGYVIKKFYPKTVTGLFLIGLFPAITFNIAANLAGMGAVTHLLFQRIPIWASIFFFAVLLIFGLIFFSYNKMALILKWLCLSSLVYVVVPFFVNINWIDVLWATVYPQVEWSLHFLSLLVAILGTTISPYLFFWQTSMSVEEQNHRLTSSSVKEVKEMKVDVNVGMLWSNLVMFFIILTTGSVLFPAGLTHIETVEDAAKALKPIAGEFAYELFALGVISTGLLAIPVLAGCLGYLFADVFDWKQGMDKKFRDAKQFYGIIFASIILGFIINMASLDPITSLIYTAIIYGFLSPILIIFILHICNQPHIMKDHINSWFSNLLGFTTLILMGGSAIFLLFQI